MADVEPGPVPDITAARIHALPALYKAAASSLPTLADKGYIGAGIGILIPVRRPNGRSEQALHVDTQMFNTLLRHARAVGERTAAELKQRWRALQHVTLSSTSRSAPTGSATSAAPPSSSTEPGNDIR